MTVNSPGSAAAKNFSANEAAGQPLTRSKGANSSRERSWYPSRMQAHSNRSKLGTHADQDHTSRMRFRVTSQAARATQHDQATRLIRCWAARDASRDASVSAAADRIPKKSFFINKWLMSRVTFLAVDAMERANRSPTCTSRNHRSIRDRFNGDDGGVTNVTARPIAGVVRADPSFRSSAASSDG